MNTEAGRILLDAFRTEPADPNFAVRISAESIIRHAIPRIEAEAVAAERARISGGLRALHERLSNEAKPKRKMCECGHPMDSHAGGWVLLHHDLFIVDRLAAAIVNPEADLESEEFAQRERERADEARHPEAER